MPNNFKIKTDVINEIVKKFFKYIYFQKIIQCEHCEVYTRMSCFLIDIIILIILHIVNGKL